MKEGDIVICGTGQAGTLICINGETAWVALRNGEWWIGASKTCRAPQSPEDLAAAPIEVSRPEPKRKKR